LIGIRDGLNRFKVAIGAGRKSRFDDIHPQALKLARDAQFLVAGHGGPRRLLAVAQGGVENDEFVSHGRTPVSMKPAT
jgi:hypothetical protein